LLVRHVGLVVKLIVEVAIKWAMAMEKSLENLK